MSSEGVPSGQGDARDSEVSVTTDSDVVSSDKRMVRERERRAAKELERKRLDLEQKRFKEYANEKAPKAFKKDLALSLLTSIVSKIYL